MLNGVIPDEIDELKNLEELDLESNQFNDQIPDMLANLEKLRVFFIRYNFITGEMPSSFCSLRSPNGSLEELWADCEEVVCDCCTKCL
mmetsp:Transcript_23849/g.31693  ORF Transcript_23849/g.31693 Transcript_23849/m.31693 type:complete len:88 (-) Transcript_23849:482-745(-)